MKRIIGEGYDSTFEEDLEDAKEIAVSALSGLIAAVAIGLVLFIIFFTLLYI